MIWDDKGFILLYKRLEQGKFQWPKTSDEARRISPQELRWLLEGLSIVQAVPIYRQEQDYKRNSIELSRQTMSNWVNRCALEWLQPVYEALKQELLKREVLCADETTLQVLREPGKTTTSKSYM